ncbi:MAG: guanylate kinase [Clostridiaceae bacterium]|nr:guanylate kinase [Clostridiaceae bacterium]
MNSGKGSLFIVTGPSGAGKGAVLTGVLSSLDNIFYSISATTRPPRPGEQDGINYYFVNQQNFKTMIEKHELLEYAEYVGNFYGTPSAPVDKMIDEGKDVVLEIEVQGALAVKQKRPDAILVFIAPPSFDVLERRLRNRGTESNEIVEMRLKKAHNECAHMDDYDYIIVNDLLDEAIKNLSAVIIAARCRSNRVKINLV